MTDSSELSDGEKGWNYIVIEAPVRVVDGDLHLAGSGDRIIKDVSQYEMAGGYAGELLVKPKGEFTDIKYEHERVKYE